MCFWNYRAKKCWKKRTSDRKEWMRSTAENIDIDGMLKRSNTWLCWSICVVKYGSERWICYDNLELALTIECKLRLKTIECILRLKTSGMLFGWWICQMGQELDGHIFWMYWGFYGEFSWDVRVFLIKHLFIKLGFSTFVRHSMSHIHHYRTLYLYTICWINSNCTFSHKLDTVLSVR